VRKETVKKAVSTLTPVRLRVDEAEAVEKLARKRPFREVLHDVIAAGVKARGEHWEERLRRAEARADMLDAFARGTLARGAIAFTESEAKRVAHALRVTVMVRAASRVSASMEAVRFDLTDALRADADADGTDLIQRVMDWGPGDLLAVLAAVAAFWALVEGQAGVGFARNEAAALVTSGLVAAKV
jgi:hypothetical protein